MSVKQSSRLVFFCNGFQFNITGAVKRAILSDQAFSQHRLISIATPLFKHEPKEVQIEFMNYPTTRDIHKFKHYPSPPFSYFLDVFWVLFLVRAHIIISFSPHITFFALILKRLGLVKYVVHWSIDFSPRRFKNFLFELIYRFFDRESFLQSSLHVDVSRPALRARCQIYGKHISIDVNNKLVVPVGIPENALEQIPSSNFLIKKIFFLGNLTDTVGIDTFVKVCEQVHTQGIEATFHVIGDGPEFEKSKAMAIKLGVDHKFTWYGNLSKEEFEPILKTATIGLAPYKNVSSSFSIYADPSKIKNYAQFGIPFVMTNIPKVSTEFVSNNFGVILDDDLEKLTIATLKLLTNERHWKNQSNLVFAYAQTMIWESVLKEFMESLKALK